MCTSLDGRSWTRGEGLLPALLVPPAGAGGVLLVAGHPDDETIGAGGVLPHLHGVEVVHVTDGAPRDRRWWGDTDAPSRTAYARARREELAAALALAGIGPERTRCLGRVDQEASARLAALARVLAALLRARAPALVLTHPCEGGHPDHDATAFAVHAACRLLERERAHTPAVVELASYHARGDGAEAGVFLSAEDGGAPTGVETVELGDEDRERKRRMLACFTTQRRTLAPFGVERERFRPAPRYDFTRPPHAGTLHYERFAWGVTGAAWRARAAAALAALGLGAEGDERREGAR